MPVSPKRLFWSSLIIAWIFDLFFWKKAPGISFFIYVILLAAAAVLLARLESKRAAWMSLLLLIPLAFFSAMTFIRLEPFTQVINYTMSLGLLALFAMTFQGGRWMIYSGSDYIAGFFRLCGSVIVRAGEMWATLCRQPKETENKKTSTVWPVIRGLLLALPVVVIMASLLASADPVFSRSLTDLTSIFKIKNLGELIFRAIYILALAYALIGVFLHIFFASQDDRLIGLDKPVIAPFLGWVEALIILASVDILFTFFVGIQFRYFFGGQTNINIEGYTYSEYARRGFGELVLVAFLSLLLFQGLSAITHRQQHNQRRWFSLLGIGLVVLVVVILISAFQRLLLYEQYYGFSRLRIYPHVFMIWLGVLLVATVILEVLQRQRAFALAVCLAVIGFGATINLLNVDAFIVRQNVARTASGWELDMPYLTGLSDDATPAMFEMFTASGYSQTIKNEIGASLACKAELSKSEQKQKPWASFHLGKYQAAALFDAYHNRLAEYPILRTGQQDLMVSVNGEEKSCLVTYID
jgi:hypothetical protein